MNLQGLSPRHVRALQPAHPGWRERNQEIRPFRTFAFSKEPPVSSTPLFSATVFSFGGCCMYRKSRAVALFLLSLLTVGSLTFGQAFAAGEDSRFDALKRFSQAPRHRRAVLREGNPAPRSGERRAQRDARIPRSPTQPCCRRKNSRICRKARPANSSASASKSRWRTTS